MSLSDSISVRYSVTRGYYSNLLLNPYIKLFSFLSLCCYIFVLKEVRKLTFIKKAVLVSFIALVVLFTVTTVVNVMPQVHAGEDSGAD